MASSYAQLRDDAMRDVAAPEEQLQEIADRLEKLAAEQVSKKSSTEDRWITDLRNFHGKYDPTVEQELKDAEKSRAFVKITRKKTNSWEARLSSLLFPVDEENWDATPTPVPSLTEEAKQALAEAQAALEQANQAQQQAQQPQQDPAQAQQQAAQAQGMAQQAQQKMDEASALNAQITEAVKRGEAMKMEMKDQLVECDYASECRLVIRDACRLGTGILKGPLAADRQRGVWLEMEDGQHIYNRESDPAPILKWVDPWSYFPDMSAIRPEDREFEFERHIWSGKDLRSLVRDKGFHPQAVRELLMEDRRAQPITATNMGYLANLRSITGTSETVTGRYIGWEYHGPLENREVAIILRALGREDQAAAYEVEDDPLKEVKVIVYFCDGKILKIAPCYPLDSGESLYSLFTFEPNEASLFGYGIPYIMADSQAAMNGAWRMALDNAGLSVGPQIFIDREAIEPANRRWKLEPRKIWYKKKGTAISGEPMQAVHITNNVQEIMNLVETARKFIDDETALPVQSEGELTDNPNITATATNLMSMASNVTFRRVVKSFDDGITVPSIRRLYDWNMQHNSRKDIKGDMKVNARGSSALLVREMQAAMLMNISQAWTQHPVLKHLTMPYEAVVKTLQSMMIAPEEIMPTKEAYQQAIQAEAQQAAAQQKEEPTVIAAKTRLEAVKIDSKARLDIAEMQRETEMMKLAQLMNMNLDELRAMLQAEGMKHASKERLFAAEAAIEDRRDREARSRGEEPKGSGGSLSA